MSDKVKLPKEVADAINSMKHMGVVAIMGFIAKWDEQEVGTVELSIIHSYYRNNPYLIASALVNGYEVEQTPEEKVRELYCEWADKMSDAYKQRDEDVHKASTMFIRGMMATLEALGVTVESVNDFKALKGADTNE